MNACFEKRGQSLFDERVCRSKTATTRPCPVRPGGYAVQTTVTKMIKKPVQTTLFDCNLRSRMAKRRCWPYQSNLAHLAFVEERETMFCRATRRWAAKTKWRPPVGTFHLKKNVRHARTFSGLFSTLSNLLTNWPAGILWAYFHNYETTDCFFIASFF